MCGAKNGACMHAWVCVSFVSKRLTREFVFDTTGPVVARPWPQWYVVVNCCVICVYLRLMI